LQAEADNGFAKNGSPIEPPPPPIPGGGGATTAHSTTATASNMQVATTAMMTSEVDAMDQNAVTVMMPEAPAYRPTPAQRIASEGPPIRLQTHLRQCGLLNS
jgi:hypothetical protein